MIFSWEIYFLWASASLCIEWNNNFLLQNSHRDCLINVHQCATQFPFLFSLYIIKMHVGRIPWVDSVLQHHTVLWCNLCVIKCHLHLLASPAVSCCLEIHCSYNESGFGSGGLQHVIPDNWWRAPWDPLVSMKTVSCNCVSVHWSNFCFLIHLFILRRIPGNLQNNNRYRIRNHRTWRWAQSPRYMT